MSKIYLLVFLLVLIPLVSSQLGYTNQNLPKIIAPEVQVTTSSSSGGNSSFNQSLTDALYLKRTGDNAAGNYQLNATSASPALRLKAFGTAIVFALQSGNSNSDYWWFVETFAGLTNASFCQRPCAYISNTATQAMFYNGADGIDFVATGGVTMPSTVISALTVLTASSFGGNSAWSNSANITGVNTISALRLNASMNVTAGDSLIGRKIGNFTANTDLRYPFNGTGSNTSLSTFSLVIPHQTYDITGAVTLDTSIINTLDRPIRVDVTIESYTVNLLDSAYVELLNVGAANKCARVGTIVGLLTKPDITNYFAMSCTVQAGDKWSLRSTVTGAGAVAIDAVQVTAL